MPAGFNQGALGWMPPLPVQYSMDPYQVAQAVMGWTGQLSNWSLSVSRIVNTLWVGGTHATVPIPGVSGGIPYFNSTTTLASSALLPTNGVVVGGGAGGAPLGVSQWTFTSVAMVGNFNAVTLPAQDTGVMIQLGNADITTCGIELVTSQAVGRLLAKRSEGTINAPTPTAAAVDILVLAAKGYANGAYTATSPSIRLSSKTNLWSATDNGSQISFFTVPDGSITGALVANFKNEGCSLQGTTTNDTAAAGFIGEPASAIVLVGAEININAATNVVTLSLTAGDWEVSAEAWFDNSTGTPTASGNLNAAITTTTGTIPTVPADNTARTVIAPPTAFPSASIPVAVGPMRLSLAATTNVFLVMRATVSAGNMFGYGKLRARRVR